MTRGRHLAGGAAERARAERASVRACRRERPHAFGPGHIDGTAAPGEDGNVVLSGHRDTHFQFLQALEVGSPLVPQAADGVSHTYRVTGMHILDERDTRVLLPSGRAQLTLVTCYPFHALVPGGPLRYVVFAQRV